VISLYEQLAYAGRLRLECGDVLLQPTFDCHADRMLSQGLVILRLPWRRECGFGGVYRGDRPCCRRITSLTVDRKKLPDCSGLAARGAGSDKQAIQFR
jgi:hypothetical protein